MTASSIQAVDHVHLQAARKTRAACAEFYHDVLGLVPHDAATEDILCFRTGQIQLRIALSEAPAIDPVPVAVVIRAPSLVNLIETLRERKIAFDSLHGFHFTEERLHVLDPSGNRVEVLQSWPMVF